MSDWWARKLGGAPPPQAPMRPAPVPAREQYAPPYTGVQQPVAFDPNDPVAAAAQWRGGAGTKTETSNCPNCGGDHYFSNKNINPIAGGGGGAGPRLMTQNGAIPVAPRCFDCGYTTAHGLQTGSM